MLLSWSTLSLSDRLQDLQEGVEGELTQVDSSGVPYHSARDLEQLAEDELSSFDGNALRVPRPVSIEEHIVSLDAAGTLVFEICDLNPGRQRGVLVGTCVFRPQPAILLDWRVSNSDLRRCVLAHEFAHFVLHRNLEVLRGNYDTLTDTEADVLTDPPARRWMEWQATRFASALMMPRQPLRSAVDRTARDIQSVRKLRLPVSDDREFVKLIAIAFDVPPEIARTRLLELGRLAQTRRPVASRWSAEDIGR